MRKLAFFTHPAILICFAALVLVAFVLLGNRTIRASTWASVLVNNKITPDTMVTQTLSPAEDRRKKGIEDLKTKIADTQLPPDTKEVIKRRLQIAEYEATKFSKHHDYSASPTPFPEGIIKTLHPTKNIGFEGSDGIIEVAIAYSSQFVKIKNVWKGKKDNEKFMVYAGAMAKTPDQGIVIVRQIGKQNPNEGTIYPTPGKFGIVEIIGYEGTVLQLESAKGDILNFDVSTGTYLGFPPATPTSTEELTTLTPATYSYP